VLSKAGINKTDTAQLLSQFSNVHAMAAASADELATVTGMGHVKVKRLWEAFHKPFSSRRSANAKRLKQHAIVDTTADSSAEQQEESESAEEPPDISVTTKPTTTTTTSPLSVIAEGEEEENEEEDSNLDENDDTKEEAAEVEAIDVNILHVEEEFPFSEEES